MSRARPTLAIGCLFATAGVLGSGTAVAAPSVTAPSGKSTTADVLDYAVDPECPGRQRFLALLEGALDPLERVPLPTMTGMRIRVEIRGGFGGYRGALEKVDAGGASAPRVSASPGY